MLLKTAVDWQTPTTPRLRGRSGHQTLPPPPSRRAPFTEVSQANPVNPGSAPSDASLNPVFSVASHGMPDVVRRDKLQILSREVVGEG